MSGKPPIRLPLSTNKSHGASKSEQEQDTITFRQQQESGEEIYQDERESFSRHVVTDNDTGSPVRRNESTMV